MTRTANIFNSAAVADIYARRKAGPAGKTQAYKAKKDIPLIDLSGFSAAELEALDIAFEQGMAIEREEGTRNFMCVMNGKSRSLKDLARVTGKAAPGKTKLPNPAGIYAARGK